VAQIGAPEPLAYADLSHVRRSPPVLGTLTFS
jgi:hypothetical protein